MHSINTILILAAVIIAGVALSLLAHNFQKGREAKAARVKKLLSECKTLTKVLESFKQIPLQPELYQAFVKQLAFLIKNIQSLNPKEERLGMLQQVLMNAENSRPPTEHQAFAKGVHLQTILKDIKTGSLILETQLAKNHGSQIQAWKNQFSGLSLDVQREYAIRTSHALSKAGKTREALSAINHALNLLEKSQHLEKNEKRALAEKFKAQRQEIRNQSTG